MTHPAACPHCGGTVVYQASPDVQIRHARLNDDGSITISDVVDWTDFSGPCLLFCHGCSSTYVQPALVVEHYDEKLRIEYPDSLHKDDPGYLGHDVVWTATPLGVSGSDVHNITNREETA